ncbi:hypothetical protein BOTBODRAFT_26034 [Botryobasidium botryosum FD-172 SS1]|uniref:Heme haloperoxidase family profile domain-containing protein n=1 Tax=Botryobasidium botryosum (strain FD-172 SS1) TaxID=930990 RepID=A0A067N0R0_BOTB1|nr:hypothetical protein BOTBODRAFT_26034 [Botryobasidium botryosum FD-172 SS1]
MRATVLSTLAAACSVVVGAAARAIPSPFFSILLEHPYIPPFGDARRSPCPALNSMANHGFLPRDGKNLDLATLVKAQHDVFNFSVELATSIATAGLMLCGSNGTLNLNDLDAHNVIEHDASLTRADAATGDDHTIVPWIVEEVLSYSSDGEVMTLDDFARARVAREAHLPDARLNGTSYVVAASTESVFSHHAFLDESGRGARVEDLRTWYLEERLPYDWAPPAHELGLEEVTKAAADFAKLVDTYR